MRLRTKAILFSVTFTVCMVAILYALSLFVLVRRSYALDERDAQHDMERAIGALDDRLQALSDITGSWAIWNETCKFVAGQAPDYVQDFLDAGIFVRTTKANYVLVYDPQGKLIHKKGYDVQSAKEISVPESFTTLLQRDSVLTGTPDLPPDARHGVLVLPDLDTPLLVAACPILPEDLSVSSFGTLVFAVCVDSPYTEEFAHSARMNVSWFRWDADLEQPLADVRTCLKSSGASRVTQILDDMTMAAYAPVYDISGQPAIILNVNGPRRIYIEARTILNHFAFVFLITGAVLAPMAVFFMQRFALNRLAALGKRVETIGRVADFSQRVHAGGEDEITDLSNNINQMLGALEEAQRAVRDNENRLRSIVDGAVDGIVAVDDKGLIQSFNQGAERIFGYSQDEVLGKNALMLWADSGVPGDLSSAEYISLQAGRIVGASHETVGRRKDGGVVHLDVSVSKAEARGQELYIGIFHDITDRVRAELALRESEGRFRALLSAAPDLMIVLDADGRYHEIYTAQSGLLVQPSEQLMGKTVYEVMPEEDARAIHDVVRTTLKTGTVQLHDYFLDIGGQQHCFAARTAPFTSEGSSYVLWVARDVTERRRIGDALVQKQHDLERELGQAAQYVRSLLPPPIQGPVHTDWRFLSSSTLGGDFLHYYWLDEKQFVFYLLDVSGHGVGAALLSVSVHNALRRHTLPDVRFDNPGEVLTALNQAFPMEENDSKFFSIWYGVYDVSSRTLRYAVGGHPPAVLFTDGRAPHEELGPMGILIGVQPDAAYDVATQRVPPGSRLYLFSDGIYEILNREARLMRRDDFVHILAEVQAAGPSRIEPVLARLYEEQGTQSFPDDVSILEIEFS